MGCGSKAAGSQPREKTPGCCGLNCLEQPQKATLKKNARWLKRALSNRNKKRQKTALKKNARWLKRAVATRNKKRRKNALWLLLRAAGFV